MKHNRYQLFGLVLAVATALQGTSVSAAVQDNDNLDACCLASEYKLPEPSPGGQAAPSTKVACQVPLGDVACCVGAEWKLDATAVPQAAVITPPAAPNNQPQSDEHFCCIATVWFAP